MMPVNPMSISAILNKPSELRKDGPQTPEEEEKTSAENKKMKRREKRKVNTASVKVAHAPSAQILYQVTGDGAAQLRPILVDRAAAWESLSVVSSAHLPRWTIHRGDIVIVDIGPKGMDYAKVSDLRRLSDGRYVIVYAWLYTRNEIARQLEVDAKLPAHAPVHLDSMWRPNAEHKMMLSTNRTMMIWDTAIAKSSQEDHNEYMPVRDIQYDTTIATNSQCGPSLFQWVRAILTMKPETQ